MAVDLYVGSISRYLAGEWQTKVQRAFAEAGAAHRVQMWHADGWQPLGREEALERAVAWRDQAIEEAQKAESGLRGPIASWQEEPDCPYAVKRLSADGIEAVMLALFYENLMEMPKRVPDPLMSDPLVAAKKDDMELMMMAHCLACDLWVPGEFLVAQSLTWPRFQDGSPAKAGALGSLKRVLDEIERVRWPHLPKDLHDYASNNTSFVSSKRQGLWPFRRKIEERRESSALLAVQTLDRMKAMTAIALERNLPMIRDR